MEEGSSEGDLSYLRMSGMDGIETLRRIRKTDDKVKVIILTGFGNPDIRKDMADLDISECLSKPIENDHLLYVIMLVDKPPLSCHV